MENLGKITFNLKFTSHEEIEKEVKKTLRKNQIFL